MGAAASSSPPPSLETAAAATDPDPPPPEAAATPAKEDHQHSAVAAAAADDAAGAPAGGGGADDAAETVVIDASAVAGGTGEGEEQGECGFCLFMKGGGCKDEFVAWEKCVEEAEAAGARVDVVERCQDVTAALRKCMDAHADYYEPILRAERAMSADLEAFKAEEAASHSAASEEGLRVGAEPPAAALPSEEGPE